MDRRWRKRLAVIAIAMITAAPLQTVYAGEVGVITAMSEKVYLENNMESTVLANILQGSSVEVILSVTDESGAVWYYIRTDTGLEGYMPAESMSVTQQEQPEENAGDEVVVEPENVQPEEQQPDNDVQEDAEEPVADEPQQAVEEIETTQLEPETVTAEPSTTEPSTTEETLVLEVSTQEAVTQGSGFYLELFEVVLAAGIVCCIAAIVFLIRKIKQMLMK